MKILITGALGHIGSYVAENIHKIKKAKETILIDNLKSNGPSSIYNLNKKSKLSFYIRDLNNKKSLNDFKNIDYLIHCASMTNAEKSFERRKEMTKNNLNCLKTVINFCKLRKVKLIHISSTSVYGKQADLVDETCEKKYLKPQSPYAKIKLVEENLLKKEKKLKYTTFRFGTIAGVSKGIRFHTAVNKFCWQAVIGQPISGWTTAYDQKRPYLDLLDASNAINLIIKNNS